MVYCKTEKKIFQGSLGVPYYALSLSSPKIGMFGMKGSKILKLDKTSWTVFKVRSSECPPYCVKIVLRVRKKNMMEI